ncbi:MAG TPA: hypothetical protein VMI06_13370, partial [Terriglobia bacterium]|nr:hypothetical protein [Terriglobia bacterium]
SSFHLDIDQYEALRRHHALRYSSDLFYIHGHFKQVTAGWVFLGAESIREKPVATIKKWAFAHFGAPPH